MCNRRKSRQRGCGVMYVGRAGRPQIGEGVKLKEETDDKTGSRGEVRRAEM